MIRRDCSVFSLTMATMSSSSSSPIQPAPNSFSSIEAASALYEA